MTIYWKAVEQYLHIVLFIFQFNPVCNFGHDTVRSVQRVGDLVLKETVCCVGGKAKY